jgi:hypothetical protein
MGTTTITVNIRAGLIKTHAKFIKKGYFLWFENFSMKAKIDYDKKIPIQRLNFPQPQKWTIPTLDLLVKLHFLPKDTICSFSRNMFNPLLQPPLFLLLLECVVRLITSLSYWLLIGAI